MSRDTKISPSYRRSRPGGLSRRHAIAIVPLLMLASGLALSGRMASPSQTAAVTSPHAAAAAGDATIRRDEYGVPHITAPTEEAAAFAHGYAAAEDHLEELATLFLRARGELASVFGDKRVAEDRQVIQLGIPQMADEHFKKTPQAMQRILDGYAAGYNQYLKEAGSRAPAWAKPVTGSTVLAHCRTVLLLNFSPSPNALLGELGTPPASNFWAIAPQKSSSKRAMLLADPHLPWRGGYVMHEVHLTVPGAINIAGASLLGFPVVTIGFNDHLGWTHTAIAKADGEQLYRVTIDPNDPHQYMVEGKSVPFTVMTTTLRVKTATGEDSHQVETLWTRYGPIVRKEKDGAHAYAFSSPNLELLDFLTEYNRMAKAQTVAQFQSALQMQQLPIMGVGYADREGNVLYVQNGRYPARKPADETLHWLSGDKPEEDPNAIVPQSKLPQLLNPKGHYVQNANNGFAFTDLSTKVDMETYPAPTRIADPLPLRAQLGLELLEKRAAFSLDDVVHSVFDPTVPLAPRVVPDLVRLIKADSTTAPEVVKAAQLLESWDGKIGPDSTGATLFVSWWTEYLRGKPSGIYAHPWNSNEPLKTPNGLGDPKAAVGAFTRVVGQLTKAFGSTAVPWKEVYRLRRGSVELPAPCAGDTVGCFNALEFSRDDEVHRTVAGGTTYVLAVEFGDQPKAMSIIPYGESADPKSPHYSDQTALFGHATLKRLWIAEADVQQHTTRRYVPGKTESTGAAQ